MKEQAENKNQKIEELSDEQLKEVAGGKGMKEICKSKCETRAYPPVDGISREERIQNCKNLCY